MHSLSNTIPVIKSRIIRRVEQVVRTANRRGTCRVLAGKAEREKCHFEELGVDGRIILKCIFKK
jgi:hypothetical protein